ncbi:hypothetical protein B6U90_02330 [Thermoplasmatales archaeon ex4484_6]|nr:MAG: hypothetical protein B6U90_02330 [Thermoplasmatales archaeon ex4484_6]
MSPDTVKTNVGERELLLYIMPDDGSPDRCREAAKRGILPVIDLEYIDVEGLEKVLGSIGSIDVRFGVRLDPLSEMIASLMTVEGSGQLSALVSLSKEGLPEMVRQGVYDTVHQMELRVYQEVCSSGEAEDAARLGADGLILRPFEGGGRVSSMKIGEFISACRGKTGSVPLLARGGFRLDGELPPELDGLVLDHEVLGADHLPEAVKKRLEESEDVSVITLLKDIDRTMRFIAGPGERNRMNSLISELRGAGSEPKEIYKAVKSEVSSLVSSSLKGGALFFPGGEGALEKGMPSVADLPELEGGSPPSEEVGEGEDDGEVLVDGRPVPPDYHDRSIAIVGMGTVFPKGIGKDNFWKMVLDGVDACIEIPRERFDWRLHYDPDPSVPDKIYTKIGAFVTDLEFNSFEFKIPPKVAEHLDYFQRFGLIATKEALQDAGLLDSPDLDRERVGVMVANSGGGEFRDWASTRVNFEEIHDWMKQTEVWSKLPDDVRRSLYEQTRKKLNESLLPITEDTMPGSLPNIASGRIANVFNFRGPNFITDAACASALSAMFSARNSLILGQVDVAVSGGLDSLMACHGFVEFCKIGALTPDGSRPFSDGANGFLMGEGGGILILKRLEDAVEANDTIYAVIRGIGGSSDGKGKGITAPNPEGQKLAVRRALEDANVDPGTISFIEAHGTSTAVGDVAEVNALIEIFGGLPKGSVGLTSVKSQIGHLKSAAGAAGTIKAALAIHHKVLPPQINFDKPNRYIDWDSSPFYVITEPAEWKRIRPDIPRRCSVSAFGFGGANFNVVLEEFDPSIYRAWKRSREMAGKAEAPRVSQGSPETPEKKVIVDREGIGDYMKEHGHKEGEVFLFSSDNPVDLLKQAEDTLKDARERISEGGRLRDAFRMPSYEGRYRLAVTAADVEHLSKQIETLKKVGFNEKALIALAAKGIFVGDRERIDHGRVCFMFPGQGSQYINMFRDLKEKYRIVRETFEEADRVMEPLIDVPLSSIVFKDLEMGTDEYERASEMLRQTEYNQPSMLTADTSMYRLLERLGVSPDIVMGHSLGEYGALIAAGIMRFEDALKAVSARGKEMRDLKVDDPGKMASVMAGLEEVEEVLSTIDGYVIPANKNCHVQTVIAGESGAVDEALEKFRERGIDAVRIPVSHAFHSEVVAPAKVPLRNYLSKLEINPPRIPVLSNVTADYYPMEGKPEEIREQVLDLLKEQVAHSVEWMGEIERAYADGCRTFVEVGPKRALTSFAYNLLEDEVKKGRVFPITSNHPKKGGIQTFNEMVGSLWSLGFDLRIPDPDDDTFFQKDFIEAFDPFVSMEDAGAPSEEGAPSTDRRSDRTEKPAAVAGVDVSTFLSENRDLFSEFMGKLLDRLPAGSGSGGPREDVDLTGFGTTTPPRKGGKVVISGSAMGLPGTFKRVFDENNLGYLAEGRNLIQPLDESYDERFIDKHIVRLDKRPDGSAEMVYLDDPSRVVHLAGRLGAFDIVSEFGVPETLADVLDITTKLSFAAGLLALRDAGIPLVKRYSQTSTGSFLPEGWELPLEMQEDTGILFASAFPGHDNLFHEMSEYYGEKISKAVGEERKRIYERFGELLAGTGLEEELEKWYSEASKEPMKEYHFPRLFMFKVLAMGHSQFAQYIKAKGPNTQVNSACASSTLAVGIAQDWIQQGRCKRVIVLGADDPTSENNIEWLGSSLLSLGALTPEKDVTKAALPFDRRRKGMIVGSGVAALIVEAEEEPRRRGMNPIVEILGTHIANSAFHGSRLDIPHIARSLDRFITRMEREWGLKREEMAPDLIFMSHETYTPARGGSSAAEVESLRRTFGDRFRDILIMNTKGYTGHAFGACIEDPVLVKCLQEGVSIPLANIDPDQIDPQFKGLQLCRGGPHSRQYGLRLAAGFGSQLAFMLLRKVCGKERYLDRSRYERWLSSIATTSPAELEVERNVLRLKDHGMGSLIAHMAVKRESSKIGYTREEPPTVDEELFELYREKVVRIFSEKTRIPIDMIDIDADMETDLGIDTVKQVELFGASRVAFDLPKDEGVNLRDYPTLRHVIRYVIQKKEYTRVRKRERVEAPVDEEPVKVEEPSPEPEPEPEDG